MGGGKFMININKNRAAEFLKNKIRNERKKVFPELDVAYIRALEAGDADLQNEIAVKKQALRDCTNIDTGSFETRDELVQLWPEDLLGNNPFPTGSIS
jgi:hypothetical protein